MILMSGHMNSTWYFYELLNAQYWGKYGSRDLPHAQKCVFSFVKNWNNFNVSLCENSLSLQNLLMSAIFHIIPSKHKKVNFDRLLCRGFFPNGSLQVISLRAPGGFLWELLYWLIYEHNYLLSLCLSSLYHHSYDVTLTGGQKVWFATWFFFSRSYNTSDLNKSRDWTELFICYVEWN